MSSPRFWSSPIRYLRWASHEKPAIFYSILIGLAGPATIVAVPPFRRLIGDQVGRPPIPLTYPSKCSRPMAFGSIREGRLNWAQRHWNDQFGGKC